MRIRVFHSILLMTIIELSFQEAFASGGIFGISPAVCSPVPSTAIFATQTVPQVFRTVEIKAGNGEKFPQTNQVIRWQIPDNR